MPEILVCQRESAITYIDSMFATYPRASSQVEQFFVHSPRELRLLTLGGVVFSVAARTPEQSDSIDGNLHTMRAIVYAPPAFLPTQNNDPQVIFYHNTPTSPDDHGWRRRTGVAGWTCKDFFLQQRVPEIMQHSAPLSTAQYESLLTLLTTSQVLHAPGDRDTIRQNGARMTTSVGR